MAVWQAYSKLTFRSVSIYAAGGMLLTLLVVGDVQRELNTGGLEAGVEAVLAVHRCDRLAGVVEVTLSDGVGSDAAVNCLQQVDYNV